MFSDKLRLRAIAVAFIGYVLLSVILFAIVVQMWIPSGIPAEDLKRLAESSHTLLLWQDVLGTVLGVAAGFLAARMSGGKGLRNAAMVGVLLALYGVLGIYLRPSHPILMQAAKVVIPIPLALFGGWIALGQTRSRARPEPGVSRTRVHRPSLGRPLGGRRSWAR